MAHFRTETLTLIHLALRPMSNNALEKLNWGTSRVQSWRFAGELRADGGSSTGQGAKDDWQALTDYPFRSLGRY
jgi:hypothetical protein